MDDLIEYDTDYSGAIRHNADGSMRYVFKRTDGSIVHYKRKSPSQYDGFLTHRDDGPAIIYVGGVYGWYLNGDQYEFDDWLDLIMCRDEEKVMLKLKYG